MARSLFASKGAHILVDGQFGSTGKGALAAWLAHKAIRYGAIHHFGGAVSSSGPNSGHTSYFKDQKIVLKQLPTFGVHAHLHGYTMPIYLSAGAIIDIDVLIAEANMFPSIPIFIHPNAAVVWPEDKEKEQSGTITAIASTQSGTGAALARKICRDPYAVIAHRQWDDMPENVTILQHRLKPEDNAYFLEVAQGFSLGINSEFYPHVTSRECTVMQAMADARIPPKHVARTYMCIRTYPIRVGNLGEHSSGGWYEDQYETTWEALGVTAELTTVTKRIRRVATFSDIQFSDALIANAPDWVAVNFLNYLKDGDKEFLENLVALRHRNGAGHFGLIGGRGPRVSDWSTLDGYNNR